MNNKRVNNGLTQLIYEEDAYAKVCKAKVLECKEVQRKTEDKDALLYGIVTDCTVFFPEGGGQPADEGTLAGEKVVDVQREDGKVYHYVAKAFTPGEEVELAIDFAVRYRRMQNHSGEHLFCGLLHKMYGYENVGFHMSGDCLTVDVNGVLTAEDMKKLEKLANEGVYANAPITAVYPETPDEMEYRSKLDLKEEIRVVIIENYDACACCAPHVRSTAEIGLIKVMDFMSHRGGTRFTLKCGGDAVDDYGILHDEIGQLMRIFSSKREECHLAAARVSEQLKDQHETITALKRQITALHMDKMHEDVRNHPDKTVHMIFDEALDEVQMRTLINEGVTIVSGVVAGFMGKDGEGYRYIIGKNEGVEKPDLRELAKSLNGALSGRGGGSPKMIQGSVAATREEIEAFMRGI
ncbi:MAG: alanyl-tRNA editing protein [Lachnospiraceae bacterium]|nr:alanyl-tRNA editing protein [Lachnospiraceae bacterium]